MIKIIYQSVSNNFVHDFLKSRKQTNGTIIVKYVFFARFINRNNFAIFIFSGTVPLCIERLII